jgi:hypothetical protein
VLSVRLENLPKALKTKTFLPDTGYEGRVAGDIQECDIGAGLSGVRHPLILTRRIGDLCCMIRGTHIVSY